jgi:hypothetical protein
VSGDRTCWGLLSNPGVAVPEGAFRSRRRVSRAELIRASSAHKKVSGTSLFTRSAAASCIESYARSPCSRASSHAASTKGLRTSTTSRMARSSARAERYTSPSAASMCLAAMRRTIADVTSPCEIREMEISALRRNSWRTRSLPTSARYRFASARRDDRSRDEDAPQLAPNLRLDSMIRARMLDELRVVAAAMTADTAFIDAMSSMMARFLGAAASPPTRCPRIRSGTALPRRRAWRDRNLACCA